MNIYALFLSLAAVVGCASWTTARPESGNVPRQVEFAKRVIVIELARSLSDAPRTSEAGTIEMGIGMLGVAGRSESDAALIDLLGLRLDGAGSEALHCQLLLRGESVSHELSIASPVSIADGCKSLVVDLKRRELSGVDVTSQKICALESEIASERDDLLAAIREGAICEN